MNAAELFLSRLEGVRQTGPDKWTARCPAHDDKSPSLSIRELDDGRILIHCFAGCEALDIVQAVGLTLADLFPEPLDHQLRPIKRKRVDYRKAFELCQHEALVIAIAADDLAQGKALSEEDQATVMRAIHNLHQIAEGYDNAA